MRSLRWLWIALLASVVGFLLGWVLSARFSDPRLDRVVVMSWGDGAYGKAFYGAYAILEPMDSGYSVRARVLIGRGNGYVHDLGELGRVSTAEEAVARWGRIIWDEDGLHMGEGPKGFFLPRNLLEKHR